MRREELTTRHEQELADYWKGRSERQSRLRQEEQEVLEHCSPEGKDILKRFLREKKEAWMDRETEELSQLFYWQAFEREDFWEKQAKRNRLVELLKRNPEQQRDRGR